MNKKTIFISMIAILIILMVLIYVAYIIDARKITTQADVQSTISAQTLTELPSPDQSILSNIYTKISNIFK